MLANHYQYINTFSRTRVLKRGVCSCRMGSISSNTSVIMLEKKNISKLQILIHWTTNHIWDTKLWESNKCFCAEAALCCEVRKWLYLCFFETEALVSALIGAWLQIKLEVSVVAKCSQWTHKTTYWLSHRCGKSCSLRFFKRIFQKFCDCS